ncbi:C3 and PZP-like alpha-2-macroglobulin domain-containing protein 8 [Wyeomyia smithii]|uniref:C3 and PZP-like alpha-2-macroglobulin domain-containing protein 8 n=1 Tax=Wyeomyia smithii TaxID=174621 RepID=UPI0024681974|nr:C3 and PZP-like alpha-2-macroglobulin domain-containing protein 8 [Wyeomyia smithii]
MANNIEFDTEDKLKYTFYPVTNGVVNFRVRASNDAHLALTSGPVESNPMLEVFIGGWKNTKSVIRKNRAKPDVSEAYIPGILSVGEYRGFWIKWNDDVITVGMEGASAAFLSYKNPEPFPINFVGVCTSYGSSGSWIIQQNEPAPSASIAQVSDAVACFLPTAGEGREGF